MENIDPKLVEEWNKKLEAEGLQVVGGEKVKIDENTEEYTSAKSKIVEAKDLLQEAMQDVLVEYSFTTRNPARYYRGCKKSKTVRSKI